MTKYQDQYTQTLVALANVRPEKEALRDFREKHELELELSGNAHGMMKRGDNKDERTLSLRDLAQRLWTDVSDAGSVEELERLLFPEGSIDVKLDWRHQGFGYQPQTRLQGAFYTLLTHNHLAKRCANPECANPFFIAARVDERYCSDKCKRAGRLATKRNWWRENRRATARSEK